MAVDQPLTVSIDCMTPSGLNFGITPEEPGIHQLYICRFLRSDVTGLVNARDSCKPINLTFSLQSVRIRLSHVGSQRLVANDDPRRIQLKIYFLISILIISSLTGCASQEERSPSRKFRFDSGFSCSGKAPGPSLNRADHVLRADSDGLIVDPEVSQKNIVRQAIADPLSPAKARQQMISIACAAERLAASKDSSDVKILVYVHGGLNNYAATFAAD